MNSLKIQYLAFLSFLILWPQNIMAQDSAPVVTAEGYQLFCPGIPINVVTDFNITDIDNTETNAVYVKIYPQYIAGEDILFLNNSNPNLTSNWNPATGTLTIQGIGGQNVPYTDLIAAVKNVMYNNIAATPTVGERYITISVGQANYLPLTGHYYMFIPSIGISWTDAQAAAAASSYYGLQGYLATITSQHESIIVGQYSQGTGWIGGSDAQTEGIWKWVTGPEAGTTFWNGGVNGSTPNFAFWNNGEPNNQDNEDYAHITAPGVGIPGSWNDLPVSGSTGDYIPKGYIVEYGGMPGDPVLQLSATTIVDLRIAEGHFGTSCGSGSLDLWVQLPDDMAYWYDSPSGGSLLASGEIYTTPYLTETTTYYASAYGPWCPNAPRVAITAYINQIPTLTVNPAQPICGPGSTTLSATPTIGSILWYTEATGGTPFDSGNTIESPIISTTTTFYAEAQNVTCPSLTREAVTVTVLDIPIIAPDSDVVFCDGKQEILDAGIINVTYLWSTGATTQNISITQAGIYTVEVTNAAGCSAVRTFTATTIPKPVITDVVVNNTTATVIMADNNPGNYEFSLDDINFQDSNVFTNLTAGSHTAYARSINECGTDSREFVVLIIPKFFTPNNDTVNDVFAVGGMHVFTQATVTIFDRYGKIVTELNSNNQYWDGTYNGSGLPANDYWYIINLNASLPQIKGHFSLVR